MQARRMTRDNLLERQRWRRAQSKAKARRDDGGRYDGLRFALFLALLALAILIGDARAWT